MGTSPLSSARAARAKIAERLRQAMLDAGLTGLELADLCGWHKSKASRIARGITPPSDDDIRAWCDACGVPELAADLVAAARTADSMYVEWRQLHRDGLRQVHAKSTPLYQRTRTFRIYASNVVPGVLQTAAYATGLLRAITTFQGTPDDVERAVEARLARSRVVFEGDHGFALLLEESVLYYRVCDDEAMAAQLGALLSLMARPNISVGIIPFEASRTVWPLEAFYAFDEDLVAVETLTAEINVSSPGEIRTYLRAFNQLSQLALRGAAARSRVTRALDTLG
ncbi:helix-turn-helix domain-containing protein [Streptomyces sp. NBC_01477]|uniref:helix-turn-helix domain-containing protein n=1 Tax=Streptomyces sp. NBC_01477 TaxID=2976015 RepID=UPI002E3620C9|nr:helix-turn-helix transcriptional regulator [Streptomyces sp. NBC_01477]